MLLWRGEIQITRTGVYKNADFKPTRLKLVTSLDIPELFDTLDSIARRWGDFDVSGTVPAPLSHDL